MTIRRVWLASVLFCLVGVAARADPSADWLNVKDLGASGSDFETTASTTAGSKRIVVNDVGDFEPGQGIIVSKCNVRYTNGRVWEGMYKHKPPDDVMETRGYDGSSGGWMTFVLDIDGASPPTFRWNEWSEGIGRTWKASKVPITGDWQPLCGGVEVRFLKKTGWETKHVISFHARDQFITTIEKIEGNILTLKDPATGTVAGARVRHEDADALQAAINQAIKENRNVRFPSGLYRLKHGLAVENAAGITIQGANGENTVLDISECSEGRGRCFDLTGGTEVTIRNFRMIGHTGRVQGNPVRLRTAGGYTIWRMNMKPCRAVHIAHTQRVLIENVHASRMANECFYSQGRGREGRREPAQYTKSITYLRCSVTDCAFNAFNNNDWAEGTSILHCRVQDIGDGNFWEGPGRFVRIVGNYVRNAGSAVLCGPYHRYPHLQELGAGQTILADNVFEGRAGNRIAVIVGTGARQVVIRDNLFVNYGSNAIRVMGTVGYRPPPFPSRNVSIAGNIINLTDDGLSPAEARTGILLQSVSDTIVSDNQIYVRGQTGPMVSGIVIRDAGVNLSVHDNLFQNCNEGIRTRRAEGRIEQVIDSSTFLASDYALPMVGRDSHLYRGWNLVWLDGNRVSAKSLIDSFEPDTLRFNLREPRKLRLGDRFEAFPPSANWNIHNNTITGCTRPVILDSYGSDTSIFRNNVINRGGATGVAQAVAVAGRFSIIDNHLSGFDEKDSAALALSPDRFGNVPRSLYRGNIVERCSVAVEESREGLWKASVIDGNQFLDCREELRTSSDLKGKD